MSAAISASAVRRFNGQDVGEHGTVITLPISQDELAAWTASSREAVAKALHLLRELHWVETHRRRIVVLDPVALRDYAS